MTILSEKPRKLPAGGEPDFDRETFLSLSREYLSALKTSLIELRSKETSGAAFVRSYSRIVDAIVAVLFQRAVQDQDAKVGAVDIAIIGMGGYGRAELAPFSDVDILVLCKRRTPVIKQIASSFIRLMWDVGFELGHSVQSLVESESTLARHMDTRTAVLESRWICGSKRIAKEVERQISRLRRNDREAFLLRKIGDATARHKTFGNSFQLVEPNVKLSPGGLRDYQTLVWLGMVTRVQTGLAALRKKGLLLPGEVKALAKAYDFLLRVRVELHLATQSKQDQLTVGMQKKITSRLGYRDKGGHLGVELFMRDYYNHTRTISRITEDIIEELHGGKNIGVLLGRKKLSGDRGTISMTVNRRKIEKDPLYVFKLQKTTGKKLDRAVRRRLEKILGEDLQERRDKDRIRRHFPELLKGGRNLSLVLRSMHETGFLAAAIPEYRDLTSLKRYDLYHHYTVDEHSFQVVQNLEGLAAARTGRGGPIARLYTELADKQVLFLGALLHDIGKIEGRGHAKKGARLARKILRRMFLAPSVIDEVSYLIEIHLLMSHFSQRRDPTDPGTLQQFCSKVKNRTMLKHLCLLTYADLKSTSPIVWTEWKRSLLWALYLKAHRFMAKKEKEPEAVYKARKSAILRSFQKGAVQKKVLEHLDMLPGRYLLTMKVSQVKQHMKLIDTVDKRGAIVDGKKRKTSTELTFCTRDKPYRLSQLCGVITLNDYNILFAHAFTRTDGKVIDVFNVEDISGDPDLDSQRLDKIRQDLGAALTGKLDITEGVERHIAKWRRVAAATIPVPFKVEFDNDLSDDVTIIDIFATDQPGLLFKITHALSDEGLTIHRARISTEATRAIDSFDVQDKRGRKITAARRLRAIRSRLENALA